MRIDERASRLAKRTPPFGIAKQRDDRLGKRCRVVCGNEMAPRFEREPLGAHCRGDDGLGHCERFENLDACAASCAERNDVYGPFGD